MVLDLPTIFQARRSRIIASSSIKTKVSIVEIKINQSLEVWMPPRTLAHVLPCALANSQFQVTLVEAFMPLTSMICSSPGMRSRQLSESLTSSEK